MSEKGTSSAGAWLSPPAGVSLQAGEVHVWLASLDATGDVATAGRGLLSEDECARADRFYREIHGRRFTAARAALRWLLGRYLAKDPASIAFDYTEQKKPVLSDENASFEFNISHSESLAVLAFTVGRPIGVDIEFFKERLEMDKIARRNFAPSEVERLFTLPESRRPQGFYNCWTRKEAYIKAKGQGLSIPLDSFTVSLAPDAAAELIWVRDDPEAPGRWSMQALDPGEGYAAAVATEGPLGVLKLWQFDAQVLLQR